jgi:hypothetical protein
MLEELTGFLEALLVDENTSKEANIKFVELGGEGLLCLTRKILLFDEG